MKILFYGDSITDMNRFREIQDHKAFGYGMGYPLFIAGELRCENPEKYQIVNRGIGGNRIVDLYARIKVDMWNHAPDVLSILIGVNDIWHELDGDNGVDIERFDVVQVGLKVDVEAVAGFVSAFDCGLAVFSCSGGASYSPKEEVLDGLSEVGVEIARTDINGRVSVTIKDGAYTVEKER